ncbi:MAG: glutamate-5-semialdehyde dehydrogenase [Verrucomicrobia bacterium]|nr:glutamate-5-semialdehyde dehydrogenase [Verrucomicrobiota bacterium]
MTLHEQMTELARRARAAAQALTRLAAEEKNRCLLAMADRIEAEADRIRRANEEDLAEGEKAGLSKALLDRLLLNEKRIAGMARGLREVAALPDPVGRLIEERTRPNGLRLRKTAVPIGVIVIIYESRPNVTADAAGLCFKAGNATILRGGKEAIRSNRVLTDILVEAGKSASPRFPEGAVQLVSTVDRAAIPALLSLTDCVDLCIPRGGEGLIRAVTECSRVPVIKHYKGVCMMYIDGKADREMGVRLAVNAKCQRPGVCNAIETLLVDRALAAEFLPQAAAALWERGVELRADAEALAILRAAAERLPGAKLVPAREQDWSNEYLDLILNVKTVGGVDEAIAHINRYGSHHSDAIVTRDEAAAQKFLNEVDSAAVYWNASTRFTDGGEFGMGAEIGISTDKIGARGPMGLEELTAYKWLCFGEGQERA